MRRGLLFVWFLSCSLGCAFADRLDRPSFGPLSTSSVPYERQYLWPEGKMPDVRSNQIAAKTDDVKKPGFDRAANRRPFIEWYRPAASDKTDVCVMTVSGGGFDVTCDAARLQPVIDRLVRAGITVADVTYRTPHPEGLPIHQSAWEDLQRAVRVVKSEAAKRGFSPDKVGATGISAGAKAVLLVATRSETRAYEPVDEIDAIPANLAFAIPQAPAYVLEDGATGPNAKKGIGAEVVAELDFDNKTCPMCFLQGAADVYSPLGAVRLYQRLREKDLAAELHLFAGRWHGFHGDATIGDRGTAWDHWCDRILAFVGRLYPEVDAARWIWSLPPQSEEDLNRLEAALPGPIYLAGTEDQLRQSRLVEEWTREWTQGAQSDLHLDCVPMTTTEKASRIQEYLNHCSL